MGSLVRLCIKVGTMKGDIEKILNKEQIKNVEHAQKHCEEDEYEYKISQVIKIFGGKLTKEDVLQGGKSF